MHTGSYTQMYTVHEPVRHTHGPGKCVGMYRMSEYSGFILEILWGRKFWSDATGCRTTQVSDFTSSAVFGFFTIYVMSFLTSQWLLSYQGQIYNYGYLASFSTILQWFCFIDVENLSTSVPRETHQPVTRKGQTLLILYWVHTPYNGTNWHSHL